MVSVECPFDGCDYTGSVGSVEGHISGSQSGDHQGEVGRHFREELVDRAEGSLNGGTTDLLDLGESPDDSGGDDRSEGGEDASSDGPPIPPGKALVASTVGLIALAFGTTTDAETSVEAADDSDGEQATDSDGWPGDDLDGGLIDG